MEKTLDLLLTIYPFEAEYFSDTTLKVDYVGSPLQEYLSMYHYQDEWRQQLGIPVSNHLVALFPGSRKGEIVRNLPTILEAAALLKQANPEIVFGISCFNETVKNFLELNREQYPILKNALFHVPKEYSYELMRDSRCAIAKSGTVTLELALHKCPTVVVYQLSTLNRLYAQYLLKVNLPHYCIVNILAKKEVFPELIEKGLNTQNLFFQIHSLYIDGEKRQKSIQACQEIDNSLGTHDANKKAAESIARCLQ
jgi:lipid-A-disaccharide synthase